MAKTGDFSFTNKTTSLTKTLTLYDMKEVENYGKATQSANRADYVNTQASSSDAREKFGFYSSPVKYVPTNVEVNYPSVKRLNAQAKPGKGKQATNSVSEGVKYGVVFDAIHTTIDSSDSTYRVDRPVRVQIDIIHEDADTITNAQVLELVARAMSTLIHESGASRIPDLRGSVVNINAD